LVLAFLAGMLGLPFDAQVGLVPAMCCKARRADSVVLLDS
jgi:hypothetical protein